MQRKGSLDFEDIEVLSRQFNYNFTEDQIVEIIHAVAGYGSNEINWEKFNRYVLRKIEKRKL